MFHPDTVSAPKAVIFYLTFLLCLVAGQRKFDQRAAPPPVRDTRADGRDCKCRRLADFAVDFRCIDVLNPPGRKLLAIRSSFSGTLTLVNTVRKACQPPLTHSCCRPAEQLCCSRKK